MGEREIKEALRAMHSMFTWTIEKERWIVIF